VESIDSLTATTVATVNEIITTLKVNSPFVEVSEVNVKKCNLLALVDTGLVSFIKVNVLLKYIESARDIVKTIETKLRNLNNELDIIGKTRIKITLFKLHKVNHDEIYLS